MPCGLNLTEATSRTAAMVGDLQLHRPHRAEERRQLPPHRDPAARELRRRHPAPPGLAARSRPPTSPTASPMRCSGDRRARRRARHGRERAVLPPAVGVISGTIRGATASPSSTRCSRASPAAPARRAPTAGSAAHVGMRACARDSVEIDELRIRSSWPSADSSPTRRARGASAARPPLRRVRPVGCDITVDYVTTAISPAAGARGGGSAPRASSAAPTVRSSRCRGWARW